MLKSDFEDKDVPLALVVGGHTFDKWSDYSFTDSFLSPADSFSFGASEYSMTPEERRRVHPGAPVSLVLDGALQGTGYLDRSVISATRGAGAVISLTGRDTFGHVVDSNMDPRVKFKPESTILQIAQTVLEPFGFTDFESDNSDSRTVASKYKAKTTKKGKTIKKSGLAKLRATEGEGCYAFLARVCTRFGFWVWPAVNGTTVILGTPDFEQEPSGVIRRTRDGLKNNVLDGQVTYDLSSQPSYLVAEGFGGGGEWGHSKLRVVIINPFVEVADDLLAELEQYQPYKLALYYDPAIHGTAKVPTIIGNTRNPRPRPMFKHDAESKNIEQLEHYARREMSMLTRKFLTAKYTIRGHMIDGTVPVSDTTWLIDDEVGDIDEVMWLTSRTLKRSRSGGTTTELEFIRLNSMVL